MESSRGLKRQILKMALYGSDGALKATVYPDNAGVWWWFADRQRAGGSAETMEDAIRDAESHFGVSVSREVA